MVAKLKPEEIKIRNYSLLERNILLISPFTLSSHKHTFKCLIESCQHEWVTTFTCVYNSKTGCPACVGYKGAIKDLKNRILSLEARNIKLLESFKGSNKKHSFMCETDGYEWEAIFKVVYNGSGCGVCAKNIVTKDSIKDRYDSILLKGIVCLDKYRGALAKHNFKCLKLDCKTQWLAAFDSVYRGASKCRKCAGRHKTEDQKAISNLQNRLRLRLSNLYSMGITNSKVYRDENGELNQLWSELSTHWISQSKIIPLKPSHGKWHLDHIIPVSWFDPYDLEQLKLCWSAKNCQWLTPSENSTKSNRIRPKDLEVFTDWHYAAVEKASYSKQLPVA